LSEHITAQSGVGLLYDLDEHSSVFWKEGTIKFDRLRIYIPSSVQCEDY
jgi:hypothetical protein